MSSSSLEVGVSRSLCSSLRAIIRGGAVLREFIFFVTSIAFCITPVIAQESASDVGASYEGEKVSSVDLVADPHIDIEPLRSLVAQKAGESYSQSKVQSSIAALQNTKRFTKVRTTVNPEPRGLRLTFILEPAYYVGIIRFPEAAKHFSYIRLLQVVGAASEYANQNPYNKGRMPQSEEALKKFFVENGYFLANVSGEAVSDDADQIVDITFHVDLGKRAKIGSVDIEGTSAPESGRLLQSVRSLRARFTGGLLKGGKSYTPSRIKQATSLIKSTLASQHYLASKVDLEPPHYNPTTNTADLAFRVDTGPRVIVRTTGARLTWLPLLAGREKRALIPIYSEGTIDRDLVDEGRQNLINYFQKKGYFDVKVQTKFERQPEAIYLTYVIDSGKKHKVSSVRFYGNHALNDGNLLAHIPVKKAHFWSHGDYSDKLLKQSVDNIEALYHDAGYEEVKVTSQVVDHEPKVDVRFNIEEGRQTVVSDITVTGNKSIPENELSGSKPFRLRSGAAFSPGKLASDRNQITVTYLDRGYPRVDVKAQIERHKEDPHRIDVTYVITEHQMVRISNTLYEGQSHTRLSLLRKTAGIKPEQPLNQAQLLHSETELYNLGIFDWATVEPKKPVTDQTEEQAMVKVHEAKRTEITYGFGFEVTRRGGNTPGGTVAVPGLPTISVGNNQVAPSQGTYASPRGSIELIRHNMRGLAETASVSLLASRLEQRALASYADPHFRGINWDSLTSVSFERTTENPLFAAQLSDGSFQLERVISRKTNTRAQLRYDFNYTSLSQLLVPQLVLSRDRDVRLSTVSAALIRDTRDQPLDAHKGSFATLNLGITPTAFGSSADFTRFFGQYATYKQVHGVVFAESARLGLAKGFSSSFVPTSQLFFAGGGTTLRGFPIDQAGPQRIVPFCNVLTGNSGCVNITVPVGGRQLFILNSEVRFPLKIMKALGGVVFYDGGNVYSAINLNQFVNNYTNTIGIGLRYSTPVGPIRIDFGHNLNPVPGIGANQYFITLGQAF
jgi:outer membrane protein insertion porin family